MTAALFTMEPPGEPSGQARSGKERILTATANKPAQVRVSLIPRAVEIS